jgi:MGT family glycosyltransferase
MLNPHIAVALELRRRGHDVAFYSGSRAADALGRLGLTHFCTSHADEESPYHDLNRTPSTGRTFTLGELLHLRATLYRWFIGPIEGQLADLEPILGQWKPNVIVCDPMVWGPFLVLAEARKVPVVILSWATACMVSGRDALVWGLVLPHPRTTAGRLRNRTVRAGLNLLNVKFRRSVNGIRARNGLVPLHEPVLDFAGRMPLYLITSTPELDYNRTDLPPSVRYVGPCTWASGGDAVPEWLAALPEGMPLVYVTEGTIEAGPRLLQLAARGLTGLPIFVLLKNAQILDPARGPDLLGLTEVPPNMRLEGFVLGQGWQRSVIERANVVVTNGGPGSVLTALAAGVPLVVVPTTWEKPETAARVVAAGAGVKISPTKCTPEALRRAVQQVLNTPSFHENARRLARSLQQAGGPPRAADLLEQFVTTGRA